MSRFLEAEEADDPILSVVNVIDVFLVIVVMLLIMVAQSAATSLQQAAQDDGGEVIPDAAERLERFETSGEIGEGQGVRAGTTYRLDDGTMLFVPDD